jgi:hypothetical protein
MNHGNNEILREVVKSFLEGILGFARLSKVNVGTGYSTEYRTGEPAAGP